MSLDVTSVSPQLGYRGDAGHDGVWGRLRGSPQPRHHCGRGQRGQVPLEKGEDNLLHSMSIRVRMYSDRGHLKGKLFHMSSVASWKY